MFRPKTLFVIGAGAGQEVGLPTGAELSGSIAEKLNYSEDGLGGISGGDDDLRRLLLEESTKKGIGVHEFYEAGRQIKRGIQFSRSIDEYINKHKSNDRVQFCSKLAIAKTIIESERRSAIFVDDSDRELRFASEARMQNSWYLEFVRILHDGLPKAELNRILDDIVIINFNYDRCFEQVLFFTLRHSYGVEAEAAAEALSHARIIHPYGSLGNLPWQGGGRGLPFGGVQYVRSHLIGVSEQIKTFYEQMQGELDLVAMEEAVRDAERIIFLGFGFHSQNMAMLKPDLQMVETKAQRIYATAYGESAAGVEAIKGDIQATMGNRVINVTGQIHVRREMKCVDLMKEYSRELSSA